MGLHSFWTALEPLSKSGAARRGRQKWKPVLRPAALNEGARPAKVEAGFASATGAASTIGCRFGARPRQLIEEMTANSGGFPDGTAIGPT